MMTRRSTLLRAIGSAGTTLLLPFVRTLEAEASATPRMRFLLVLQSNGMFWDRFMPPEVRAAEEWDPKNWWPAATSQTMVDNAQWTVMPPTMTSLERHRSRTLIVDGLANRQNGLKGNHLNGPSCVTAVPNREPTENGKPGGPSFDQYLATQPMMARGAFPSVDLLASMDSVNGSLLATGPDKYLPLLRSPREALKRYFGGGVMGQADAAMQREKRKRILDLVRADINRLARELSWRERERLDEYVLSVDALDRRLQSEASAACTSGQLTLPADLATAAPTVMNDIEDLTASMLAIATEALICGVTQVASVSIATGSDHYGKWARVLGDSARGYNVHQLSHGDGPGYATLDVIWNYVAGQLALVVDRLATAREAGRSILDQTIILWMSSIGGQHHHPGQFRCNAVILGDAGGKLRGGGRYIRFPTSYRGGNQFNHATMVRSDSPHTHSMGDLFCTIAHALGVPTDSFGAEGAEPVKGAIPELLA